MPPTELSDRGAVLRTLEEFDRPGREAFPARHGFGPTGGAARRPASGPRRFRGRISCRARLFWSVRAPA
jgi:hypothetical protein